MIYEIYIDTLFLMNFGMNLYLLELTNCILHRTATWRRVFFGALSGGIVSVLPFFLPGKFVPAGVIGALLSILCMSGITFCVTSLCAYLHILELISVLTVLLGSFLVYILRKLPENFHMPLLVLFFAGALCFLVLRRIVIQKNQKSYECKVTLQSGKTKIKVNALVDTGNSLVEPISGKPAAVLDKGVFNQLFFEEKPGGFRVIPYRTIDKTAGILPGYLIPEIRIEWKGCCKVFHNVYVGVRRQSQADGENYKMIINPEMLKERKIS